MIVIDDAHNTDGSSWEYFCELRSISNCLVVMSIRQSQVEKPNCQDAVTFMTDPDVKMIDLSELDHQYMAPLACQMMNVMIIPNDLDQ